MAATSGVQISEREPGFRPGHGGSAHELVAGDDAQLRPVLLGLEDRRLPLAGEILEAVRVDELLLELSTLKVAHLRLRRVADDLSTRRLSSALAIGRA